MATTTWMLMVKIVRPSSISALANPIFKVTRVSRCLMRLESNHTSQQRVSDTRSIRPLSCGVTCWKPSGPETDNVATNIQSRNDQKQQGKPRRFFRSRTPWLGKRSSRHDTMPIINLDTHGVKLSHSTPSMHSNLITPCACARGKVICSVVVVVVVVVSTNLKK